MGKLFHVGDIISVATGRLVSPSHMGGVYGVVDYVTGVPHFSHQLPRGTAACAPHLIEQHPWLTSLVVPDWVVGQSAVSDWLALIVTEYGEFHEVEPMPPGATLRTPR